MKQLSVITFSLFFGVFMSLTAISDAEAKRLGGGKSFGSSISKNKSAKRTSSTPNKAQQQNASQKQALSKKGGMMGLLGGLMIGGALGALFFGGAFENINFMDILLFGGIAFLLFKLLSRRGRGQQQVRTANGAPMDYSSTNESPNQTRHAENNLSGNDSSDTTFESDPEEVVIETSKIPRDFDQKSFLIGAENVYTLLQKAWDNGELGDLREFCTDNVFGELQDQFHAREKDSVTEIVSLKSELVNLARSTHSSEATVIFNVKLKEHDNNEDEGEITLSQEAWYFVRPDNKDEHKWLLDGIQQVDD